MNFCKKSVFISTTLLCFFLFSSFNISYAQAQSSCPSNEQLQKLFKSLTSSKNHNKNKDTCNKLINTLRCISLENAQIFISNSPVGIQCFSYLGSEIRQTFENLASTLKESKE